ncbi:uncharacterized protein K452DRAFT_298229 [Aplosporella prunicola CBS 121167]|uniref:CFEM domain-containing protein n=1 Tax=Aplosporella prunicola CBS 121167 TaxID=1176127 RepID=A0A6A6BDI7_9PEZI|nr:uncharacterized protein K452DRAFT_298229 [Aplosporella prunicola CBS 121167]KAF2142249.1 hypothetical protein K452DRAFT_298229 [Aplosporella prunicola CBS 121167]
MRFSTIAVALCLSSVAICQLGQVQLPTCAEPCMDVAVEGCSSLDFDCICRTKSYIADLTCCVFQKCSLQDQEAVIQFAQTLCIPRGFSDIPSAATCASSSSKAAATSSTGSSRTAASVSAAATPTGTGAASASSTAASASREDVSASASASASRSSSSAASAAATAVPANAAVGARDGAAGMGVTVAAVAVAAWMVL